MWKADFKISFLNFVQYRRPTPEDRRHTRQARQTLHYKLEEEPECPICFKKYTPVKRALKILNCYHFLCTECWNRIKSGGSECLRCPICRAPQPGYIETNEEDAEEMSEFEGEQGIAILAPNYNVDRPYISVFNFPMMNEIQNRDDFLQSIEVQYPDLYIEGFPNEYDIVPKPRQDIYLAIVDMMATYNTMFYNIYKSPESEIQFSFDRNNDWSIINFKIREILINHDVPYEFLHS